MAEGGVEGLEYIGAFAGREEALVYTISRVYVIVGLGRGGCEL